MKTNTEMRYKGFSASVMEAERLVGDHVFGLPPGTALPVYCSDIFKEYPQNWMRGPGVFVIPVRPNKGLWFNWCQNDSNNTAVLPTVKGCNPITGLQTSGYHLERYDNKCPKHGKEFGPDRYCEGCGYKWPFGNYIAAPNILWFDGFRNSGDGTVRQFFFTEDEVRDIATKMIGKENTVPAFGFAFYRPKVERPRAEFRLGGSLTYLYSDDSLNGYKSLSAGTSKQTTWTYTNSGGLTSASLSVPAAGNTAVYTCNAVSANFSGGMMGALGEKSDDRASDSDENDDMIACAAPASPPPNVLSKSAVEHTKDLDRSFEQKTSGGEIKAYRSRIVEDYQPKKEVAVGAGAKIAQDLVEDPYPLDTWKDAPDSVMTIYFVFKDEVDRMLSKGTVDVTEKPEGMLAGMPVG